jgi:hypothetical protein
MWGNFAILQTEIPLTVTDLGGRIYGAAQVTIDGRPTVCVGTTDEASQTTRISWQTTDGVIPPAVAAPSEVISAISCDVAVFEMGEYKCGAGDVADLAGACGDVLEGAPAAGEQGEPALAEAA